MKKLTLLLLLIVSATAVWADKKLSHQPKYVQWEESPRLHPIPPQYKNEHAYFITNDQFLDYRQEGRHIDLFTTTHWIVKVLDEIGIEEFGANGISVNRGTRVPLIKARTIMPDGTVRDLPQDMIKVTKDEYGRYKIIFAMEGVEKNAEIEVLVQEIKRGFFGNLSFQYDIPVQTSRLEISYPKDILFEEKGFNGYPTERDSLLNNRRHISITQTDIPALKNERASFYDLHRMRCEYRIVRFLDGNENDSAKLFTWDDFGKMLFDDHCKISEKEKAAVNGFLSDIGVAGRDDEAENIRKIENGIKNTITLYPFVNYDERSQVIATYDIRSVSVEASGYDEPKNVLDSIITSKAASEEGYVRLFAACFAQAGIKYELGMAPDHGEHEFSSKFENWSVMSNYLFYFPNLGQYLAPTELFCRYPIIPSEVLNTKGVFCAIPPSGFTTGKLADIRSIRPLAAQESQKNITADITFGKDMDAGVNVTYSYSGYTAEGLRAAIAVQPADKMKDLVEKILPLSDNPDNILSYKILNDNFDSTYSKPLEITANINAPQLTEKAGKDYIFKLGDVIGNQGEMYTTERRTLPVDLEFPYELNRTITVNLPAGYKIVNPDIITRHEDYVDDKLNPVVKFYSDYKIIPDNKKGDKLVVTIKESYSQSHYPVSEYERYRKIFNAAADFNKVALVVKKKGA